MQIKDYYYKIMSMGNPVLGELLILFLLILNCSRIFFIRFGKIDSLTILSPICIILSILQIVAWNGDSFSIFLLLLTIFSFMLNFRALMRFVQGLYVDHYSSIFKFFSVVLIIVSFVEMGMIIYFKPRVIHLNNYSVTEKTIRLKGSFTWGFQVASSLEFSNGIVKLYNSNNSETSKKESVMIIMDKRGDIRSYCPYAYALAQMGYSVYIADFYAKDLKWFHDIRDIRFFRAMFMRIRYFINPSKFEADKEFFAYNSMKEMEALLSFIKSYEGEDFKSLYCLSDWMGNISLLDFKKISKGDVLKAVSLCDFKEYKTKGFGFVDLTNPFVSYLLGVSKAENDNKIKYMMIDSERIFVPEE